MSIEQTLERIAVALEKLVGGPGAEVVPVALVQTEVPAPKAKKVKAEKAAEKVEEESNDIFGGEEPKVAEKAVTEEAVREIVKKYAETETPEKAMELLKKFKVKRLRELKPEQYAEVVEVFTEALNG